MITKYILHGGFAQHVNQENDLFFKEILSDTNSEVGILLVEFAHSPEKRLLNAEIDKSQFERVKGDKQLSFIMADEQSFPGQIKQADVVYLAGGTTVQLLDVMKKYFNLKDLFIGKIVAGESAGANILSTYCYSKSGGGIMSGMGLVPVKIIPHYTGEHKEEIEVVTGNLETLLLPEYKYKVFMLS